MEVTSEAIIGWTRVVVLLLGMGIAAWMDHKNRRVANEHWIEWSKPAVFIWALDLMNQGADLAIYLTASGVVAYASISVFGRPTWSDARKGSRLDRLFLLWYVLSMAGFIAGAILYQSTTPVEVLLGDGDAQGILWWKTASVFLVIFVIDLAWRFRLLHGGADAKALMWVTLLLPTWATMPLIFSSATDAVILLPVSVALLIWGGLAFLFIPIIMLVLNVKNGHIRSFSDLRLAWHASVISIDEVTKRHVWLLSDTMEMPNGETRVVHHARAPRQTPSEAVLAQQIQRLEEHGLTQVWVSFKMPLLVFLFPAILPLVVLGEPTALLLNWLA